MWRLDVEKLTTRYLEAIVEPNSRPNIFEAGSVFDDSVPWDDGAEIGDLAEEEFKSGIFLYSRQ